MISLDVFCIELDNPEGVFIPGQTVTGKVQVSVSKEAKRVKSIILECKGMAEVSFSTNSGKKKEVYQTESEKYFEMIIPVVDQLGDGIVLGKGNHNYPFSFPLPKMIPSSFSALHGHIRYTIRGIMERSWDKGNDYCIAGFTVKNFVDLNIIPHAKLPNSGTQTAEFGLSCCCRSGQLNARVWVDRIGYIPGEIIYFNADAENLTGTTMRRSKVQLIECTTYRANGETISHERVLSEKVRGKFDKTDVWQNEPFIVPLLSPSNLPYCKIMDVSYRIQYVIQPRIITVKYPTVIIPLTLLIGNVALRPRSDVSNYSSTSISTSQPSNRDSLLSAEDDTHLVKP